MVQARCLPTRTRTEVKPVKAQRQDRERAGRRAENRAVWFLKLKGYQILDRRVKTRQGEIDIIARKGQTLVIVEVKQRQTEADARGAIRPQDWARLSRAAESYVSRTRTVQNLGLRYDAVYVIGRWRMIHERDAWRNY